MQSVDLSSKTPFGRWRELNLRIVITIAAFILHRPVHPGSRRKIADGVCVEGENNAQYCYLSSLNRYQYTMEARGICQTPWLCAFDRAIGSATGGHSLTTSCEPWSTVMVVVMPQ